MASLRLNSLLCAVSLSAALGGAAHAAAPLPALNGDPGQTSVSGLSSGAFMAGQYQVAYSASVKGAGIVAGGPYYCAGVLGYSAAAICMGMVPFVPPNPYLMWSAAQVMDSAGQIDPLSGLKSQQIYVFSGTKDTVVQQQAVDSAVSFYKLAQVPDANIHYVKDVPSGHALITPAFGNDCAANATPYISHCAVEGAGYDQAGALLKQIYGELLPAAQTPSGSIVAFNQREFANESTGMADEAYLYIPQSCTQAGSSCKVHVALHGCEQSAKVVGDKFYTDTGYNSWADSNQMLVLYPQVNASKLLPFNPKGCWDWVGYTGPAYATKAGVQMAAIKAMVDRLTSAP